MLLRSLGPAQVHDQLCAGGLPTNLVTGQERREVAGARHTACTTEMASTSRAVDVAVSGTAGWPGLWMLLLVLCRRGSGADRCRRVSGDDHAGGLVKLPTLPSRQVLDEIQMLGDESRGWAFTRALLGLPAHTLHVCGDPAALPLLERIVAETGQQVAC